MSGLACPVCQGSFREVLREGVLIDVCTQCRGVWLDRGELDKLLAIARESSDWGEPQGQGSSSFGGPSPSQEGRHSSATRPPSSSHSGPFPRERSFEETPYREDFESRDRRWSHSKPKKSKLESFFDLFD